MTNHPNRNGPYELTFWGGVSVKYRRNHKSIEAARSEAARVLAKLPNRAAHHAIIYDERTDKQLESIR